MIKHEKKNKKHRFSLRQTTTVNERSFEEWGYKRKSN